MGLTFGTDLSGKVAVVTGAGGVLCGMFARTLSEAGAAVALLDINEEAAAKAADEITRLGGRAVAYRADVMDKEELESVHARVLAQLGPCDILVNGAGGNQACANTAKDYFEMGDIEADVVTFFRFEMRRDRAGAELKLHGPPSHQPGIRQGHGGPGGLQHTKHILSQRPDRSDADSDLQRRGGGLKQFHPVAVRSFCKSGNPGKRHCPGFLCNQAE